MWSKRTPSGSQGSRWCREAAAGPSSSAKLGKIPERAFFRCKSLKKIYIPKSVKVIEAEAFAFCTGLEEVYIPDQTVIAEKAFEYCDQVKIFRGEPNEIS